MSSKKVTPIAICRVLIADATPMGCELLSGALERNPGLEVFTCVDPGCIVETVSTQKINVALISIRLGDEPTAGFTIVEHLREQFPATRVIALLDCNHLDLVVHSFRCGAKGIFCRTDSYKLLPRCIQCVQGGQVWANSAQLEMALAALSETIPVHLLDAGGNGLLTQREEQIVTLVGAGLTNRAVARQVHVSEHTVKNHLSHIFEKLGISNRVELVLYSHSSRQHKLPSLVFIPNGSSGKRATA